MIETRKTLRALAECLVETDEPTAANLMVAGGFSTPERAEVWASCSSRGRMTTDVEHILQTMISSLELTIKLKPE